MGKFFYKDNGKNYKKGGKVNYNNGGKTDDDNPVATRNTKTDFFDPNLNIGMNVGGTPGFKGNFNPRISIGPDTKIGNTNIQDRGQGRFTLGPNFGTSLMHSDTGSGFFGAPNNNNNGFGAKSTTEQRFNVGAKASYQSPIGNKGLIAGVNAGMGSAFGFNRVDDQSQGTYQGTQTTNLKDINQTGYTNAQASLGYYPPNSNLGGKAFIGYGSEGSTNPGTTYGAQFNAGPATFNINKSRQGFGGGFGLSLPLGSPTRRVNNTGDPNLDYDNGGVLDPRFIEAYERYNQGKRPQQFFDGGQVGDHGVPFTGETQEQNLLTDVKDYFNSDEMSQYKQDLGNQLKQPFQTQPDPNASTTSVIGDLFTKSGGGSVDTGGSTYNPDIDPTSITSEFGGSSAVSNIMGKMGKAQGYVGAAKGGFELGKDIVDGGDAEGNQKYGKGILGGAMKGQQAGAAFGPYGRLIGGAVGALAGGVATAQNKNALEQQETEAFNQKAAGSTNDALLSYLKDQNSPVIQTQQAPEDVIQGAQGMKIGDKNSHVSDESYQSFSNQLKSGENGQNKGYDNESGLWFPFDVGINNEQNIGWGINMSTLSAADKKRFSKGVSTEEIEGLYNERISSHLNKSQKHITSLGGNWDSFPDNIKLALTDFSYNLGSLKKFPKFTQAIIDNDLATAKKEYKRFYTQNGKRTEMVGRNEEIDKMIFQNAKGNGKIYKAGGMTSGEYNHETNPLSVIDSDGNHTGMELTGGEGVYDAKAQKKIELAIKKKDYKKVGKIIEYEINDWKQRGMYS